MSLEAPVLPFPLLPGPQKRRWEKGKGRSGQEAVMRGGPWAGKSEAGPRVGNETR